MAVQIKARHTETGKIRKFSDSDWYNYSQTGLWVYMSTEIVDDPVPTSQPRSIQKTTAKKRSGGCKTCGRK